MESTSIKHRHWARHCRCEGRGKECGLRSMLLTYGTSLVRFMGEPRTTQERVVLSLEPTGIRYQSWSIMWLLSFEISGPLYCHHYAANSCGLSAKRCSLPVNTLWIKSRFRGGNYCNYSVKLVLSWQSVVKTKIQWLVQLVDKSASHARSAFILFIFLSHHLCTPVSGAGGVPITILGHSLHNRCYANAGSSLLRMKYLSCMARRKRGPIPSPGMGSFEFECVVLLLSLFCSHRRIAQWQVIMWLPVSSVRDDSRAVRQTVWDGSAVAALILRCVRPPVVWNTYSAVTGPSSRPSCRCRLAIVTVSVLASLTGL